MLYLFVYCADNRGMMSDDSLIKAMGQRVRQVRRLVFKNQTEAGQAVGISQTRWGAIERGETDAREHREALARVLGVRLEWLMFGEEPMRVVDPGHKPERRIAEPDKDYNIGQLLYEMAGDLHALREDCRALHQRMARLEAEAGAAHDHSGANAG